ncbi:MAG: glycosyl transferase family 2 [Candidatus Brocadiaceae bacterium]|nr:glycosyl transferase family 2 [Candidatus Brocadiaceae bacterium]
MNTPLISVVMPVHNGQNYLADAIDSILMQTHRNLELIIVDDGSSDATSGILLDYVRRDAKIQVITIPHRKGQGHAVNAGVKAAQGEWIARMDADDIAHPQRLVRQWQTMEALGLDACGSWAQCFGQSDRLISPVKGQDAMRYELLFTCPLLGGTTLLRGVTARTHLYDERSFMEDYELCMRLVRTQRIGNIAEILLYYRIHSQQSTQRRRAIIRIYQQQWAQRYFKILFPRAPTADQDLFMEVLKRSPTLQTPEGMAAAEDLSARYFQTTDEEAQERLSKRWLKLRPMQV